MELMEEFRKSLDLDRVEMLHESELD
jgi:hypothetical protein